MGPYTEDGSVDIHGRPALRRRSGNWRASAIIMGEICLKIVSISLVHLIEVEKVSLISCFHFTKR